MNDTQTPPAAAFSSALSQDDRNPAIVAESAINEAMIALDAGDAQQAHNRIEYAKYVLIVRRCGMHAHAGDLQNVLNSPGLRLCSGLSNASEMAAAGQLSGLRSILAEAAMRTRALAV